MDNRHGRTLQALAQSVLPSDDGPGALEAGVAEYVAKTLREPRFQGWRPLFDRGFETIEAAARKRFQRSFADCSAARKDELLRQLQASADRVWRTFFRQFVVFCLEGFLCRPVHGGNREQAGWRYVGYPPEGLEEDGCLKAPRS